jgi:hypothetical protein
MRCGGFLLGVKLPIIGVVLLLPACSMGSLTDAISPLLSSQHETPAPEPEPAYRQLIVDHLGELFAANAEVHNAWISNARKVDPSSSAVWRVCLKAEMKVSDGSTVTRTYVVLIQRGQIADRRSVNPSDKCDEEKYEPLSSGKRAPHS